MKEITNPIISLLSAAKDTAISHVSHKLWQIQQKQKKRESFMDSLKTDKTHSDAPETEAYAPKVREMTPTERAIQAFLTSSSLNGYADPFLELEPIKNCPNPKEIAQIFNQALCIIRYLCKGDIAFCEGALSMIVSELELCMENNQMDDFHVMRAFTMGACAMDSEAFKQHFVHQPHEQWKHAYIIKVDSEITFNDFMGMVQSMFATLNYTCPDFPHLIQPGDHLGDWVSDINAILEPMNLKLVQLDSDDILKDCIFVLLKTFECNVLNGMMAEILS